MTIAEHRRSPGRWLGLLWLLGAPAAAAAQAPPIPPAPPAWLAGCWLQTGPGLTIEEVWLRPAGGSAVGASRTMAGDTLSLWELMVIRP
ncbi:MAG: DUF6265 family protein, partial [Gemmatimonadota bacterium]|nr:DUF6265 family protein [Gemmatimonadota bacterium]